MKKRLLCLPLPKPNRPSLLSETEANHATRVLRLRDGDLIEAMDGKGNYAATTLRVRGGHPSLEYREQIEPLSSGLVRSPLLPLVLEMAILKGAAMEWVVEKSVELGVKQLIPIVTDHTVVQMKNKGPSQFQERWQKIADQALKQCCRLDQMEIALPLSLDSLLMTFSQKKQMVRIWCDEASREQSPFLLDWLLSQPVASQIEWRILIGPEGGWSSHERDFCNRELQNRVHLGPNILRAETAALYSVSLVSAFALKAFHK